MASYEKQPNGTWSVRFRNMENFKIKNKRLSGFKTKKEAEQAYIEYVKQLEEEKETQITKSAKKLVFKELYDEYCDFKQARLKQSSYYDFDTKARIHILPFFENYIVSEISPKLILKWQSTLDKYSFKYKCCLRVYLSGILRYAQRYYNIPNQLQNVDNFKDNSEQIKEMAIWSEEEFSEFIKNVDRIDYKAYFSALYLTGCRKGELLATNWNDWDLRKNILSIQKNITRKVYGKSWTITTPKNLYSIRRISITDKLSQLMKEYKIWQQENLNNTDFVFGGSSPFADSNVDRYFKLKCEELGIRKIRIHDFRHSHASLLISSGLSIVAVAKRLGHKDIEQTLNTYSHLLKNDEVSIVSKLDGINI